MSPSQSASQIRDMAVKTVDGRHGYTMEFSDCPDAHREEYDREEERMTAVPPVVYRAGWDAYAARQPIGTNPHEFGSPEWVAWREGYTDAEGERIKELTDRGL